MDNSNCVTLTGNGPVNKKQETIKEIHEVIIENQQSCISMLNELSSDIGVIMCEGKAPEQAICHMLDEAQVINSNSHIIYRLIAEIRGVLI